MNDLYTPEYLINTLSLLESEAADLRTWSVYNGDQYNQETNNIQGAIDELKEIIQGGKL